MYLHFQVLCIHLFYDYSACQQVPDIILDSGFVLLRPSNYNSGSQKVGLNATAALPVQFIVWTSGPTDHVSALVL